MSGGTLKLKKKKQPLLCKLKGLSTFKNQDLMVFVNIHCCQLSLIFVLYFASVANLSLLAYWYITFLGCWIAASVFFYTQQAHFFHSSLVGPLLTSSSPSVSPVVFWLISFSEDWAGLLIKVCLEVNRGKIVYVHLFKRTQALPTILFLSKTVFLMWILSVETWLFNIPLQSHFFTLWILSPSLKVCTIYFSSLRLIYSQPSIATVYACVGSTNHKLKKNKQIFPKSKTWICCTGKYLHLYQVL